MSVSSNPEPPCECSVGLSPEMLAKCRDMAERLRISESIEELSSALLAETDLDQITALVAEKGVKLTGAAFSSVTVADWDTSEVRVIHSHGGPEAELRDFRLTLDNSLNGWVLKTGQPALVNDVSADKRVNKEAARRAGISMLLIVPLNTGRSVIGTLAVANKLNGPGFTMQDQIAAEMLARRAAVALANAEAYQRLSEAQAAADAERRKLEAVVRNVGMGVVLCDARGTVTLANQAAHELLGVSDKTMPGWPLTEFSPPGNKSNILQILDDFERGDGVPRRSREITCDLRARKIRLSIYGVKTADPRLDGFVVLIQDVTGDVEIAEAAADFVSTLSHEIKTPLTALSGVVGLVAGGAAGRVGQRARDLLQISQNNINRLVRLVDDLMDIGRIESGRLRLRLQETSVVDCVQRAVDSFRPRAKESGVRISVVVKPDVPHVIADPDRLEQVAVNLISNAIKFSPTGGEVRVTVRRSGNCVRVAVADEGRGVPDAEKDRIFDKFYQGAKLRDGERGIGLGLPISKAIVEQHGGSIYVRDRRGKGSRFVFALPIPPYNKEPEKDSA